MDNRNNSWDAIWQDVGNTLSAPIVVLIVAILAIIWVT